MSAAPLPAAPGDGAPPSPLALAGAAWGDLARDFAVFARLAAIPFAWTALAGLFFATYQPFGTAGWFRALQVVAEAAGVVLLLPAATAWHRLVVLGRDHPEARLAYSFRREEWRYLVQSLVLLLFIVVIGLVVGVGLGVLSLVLGLDARRAEAPEARLLLQPLVLALSLGLLAPRFLLLPAAASGGREPPELLRRRARRAHWPVVAALLLVFVPWALVAIGVQRALGASHAALAVLPLAVLHFAMIAASLGVLSHAYLAIGTAPVAADA